MFAERFYFERTQPARGTCDWARVFAGPTASYFRWRFLGTCTDIYKYSHRMHPELWVYLGLAGYAVAFGISGWRFLRIKSEPEIQMEPYFYFFCIYILMWLPGLIHGLLT